MVLEIKISDETMKTIQQAAMIFDSSSNNIKRMSMNFDTKSDISNEIFDTEFSISSQHDLISLDRYSDSEYEEDEDVMINDARDYVMIIKKVFFKLSNKSKDVLFYFLCNLFFLHFFRTLINMFNI